MDTHRNSKIKLTISPYAQCSLPLETNSNIHKSLSEEHWIRYHRFLPTEVVRLKVLYLTLISSNQCTVIDHVQTDNISISYKQSIDDLLPLEFMSQPGDTNAP